MATSCWFSSSSVIFAYQVTCKYLRICACIHFDRCAQITTGTCVYACMHMTRLNMHQELRALVFNHLHVYTRQVLYTTTYMYLFIHTRMFCKLKCLYFVIVLMLCGRMYVCIYIYIYIYIHTYIHIHNTCVCFSCVDVYIFRVDTYSNVNLYTDTDLRTYSDTCLYR